MSQLWRRRKKMGHYWCGSGTGLRSPYGRVLGGLSDLFRKGDSVMLYRNELCDLDDPIEGEICLRIFLSALVSETVTVKIRDETQEGRNEIIELLKRGFRIVSIKD